jgi:uncharacterized integral membrane protein
MRFLSWISGILLFLLALGFAIKNSEIVTLHYYLGYQWQAPLVVVVLTVFCTGAGVGIAATLGFVFRQRREILKLRRELRDRPLTTEALHAGPIPGPQTITTQRPDHGI